MAYAHAAGRALACPPRSAARSPPPASSLAPAPAAPAASRRPRPCCSARGTPATALLLASSRARPPTAAASLRRLRCAGANGDAPRASAEQVLQDGTTLYAVGERMAALKLFELALRDESNAAPSETRARLLYSAGCCHAAFGDIELAWMNLREAAELGLPHTAWESESAAGLIRMEASPQMRIQLRKYAEGKVQSSGTYAREQFARKRAASAAAAPPLAMPPGGTRSASQYAMQDLEVASDTGESFVAIAQRVGMLLAVAAAGGIALYFAGLSSLR